MELTRFDVVTGKGRSKEGIGNEYYKALIEENKVCRLVDSTRAIDMHCLLKTMMMLGSLRKDRQWRQNEDRQCK